MIKLVGFLFRYAPVLVVLAIAVSVITGLINTALLAFINDGIKHIDQPTKARLWGFVGFILALPLIRAVSQLLLTYLTQRTVFQMRIRLSRHILAAPLATLERFGPSRLLAALTTDIRAVSGALSNIPYWIMSITVIVSSFAYLIWIHHIAGLSALVAAAVCIMLFRYGSGRLSGYFRLVREAHDTLYAHFRALTDGNKELKLHRNRRHAFVEELLPGTAGSIQTNNMKAQACFAGIGGMMQVAFFLFIGSFVFILPMTPYALDSATTLQCAMVAMFIWGPFDRLSTSLSILTPARVALQKIHKLGLSLEKATVVERQDPNTRAEWRSLALQGVTHAYYRERENESFTLGPIDLAFRPGELVFITGGNGSGKTTLAKLILGLYAPDEGRIVFDGREITDEARDDYRQIFTAVFSDFFLFEAMLGLEPAKVSEKAVEYLELLQLQHKVSVDETGALSTLALSQGQRKRLALLTAYLEDRPIYLFDEWAADQDPLFKEIFYLNLLPELKQRGKTVLVISHDDHYYHVADRLIKLDSGRVEFDRGVAPEAAPARGARGG